MRFNGLKTTLVFLLLLVMRRYSYAETDALDFGPLLVRPQAPLQTNGVNTRLRDAVHSFEQEVFFSTSAASVWAESDDYTLDYYQNDVFGGLQLAVNSSMKFEISYVFRYAINNHLDSLTIFFHDLTGMSQNGREAVDNDRFYIDVPEYYDDPIEDFEGEILGNAWEVYLEQLLFKSSMNTLSVGGTLYYNYIHSGLFRNASFEQAVQLNYTGKFGPYHSLYIMGGVTHRSPDNFSTIALKEWAFNVGVGYQYRANFSHAYLIEYRIYEGEAEELGDLSDPVNEISVGYRFHFGKSAIEFAMVENIISMDNSADIAFTASFRHRL
jgi:hypothetical protein